MDEMNERSESAEARETGAGELTPHGATLPIEHEAEGVRRRKRHGTEGVTLRYRRRHIGLLRIGGFSAVLVLLVAVLLIAAWLGRGRGASGEGTSTSDTAEPTETTGDVRDLYFFDPEAVPEGERGVRPYDLSGSAGSLADLAGLSPDPAELLLRFGAAEGAVTFTEPTVLILHTHSTEAYLDAGAVSWDGESDSVSSKDAEENVLAVGRALADALDACGIETVHATVCHDVSEDGSVSYRGAYARSAETVAHYLALYPSIRFVIDLHREALEDADGNVIRAVVESEGEAVAQVMATVGSGEGIDHESNLALALIFTEEMNRNGERIARPPTLKGSPLGQGHSGMGLTLEIGTAGNSLEEALRAIPRTAEALAAAIGRTQHAGAEVP